MIMCTIFSVTWCRTPEITQSDSNQLTSNDHSASIIDITGVYQDYDKKNIREPPPKYNEVIKSSIVDRLPTYSSFRKKSFFS